MSDLVHDDFDRLPDAMEPAPAGSPPAAHHGDADLTALIETGRTQG